VQQLSSAFQSLNAKLANKEEVEEEQEILGWVCDYNYQAQHHRACKLHCDNTSSWILEHPVFLDWMQSGQPVLWFRGAAGSGKTILASYVVEHLLQSSASARYPVAFFYFDKSTNQSLSFETFLASILRQLCILRGVPRDVKEAFKATKLSSGGINPIRINQLISMTRQIIEYDRPAVVIVDGVDEAEDVTRICDFIATLSDSKSKFFICSRAHNAIADALRGATKLSAPSASASSDIAHYIDQRLGRDPRLRKMAESLKSHVREVLGEKAAGMYVSCSILSVVICIDWGDLSTTQGKLMLGSVQVSMGSMPAR
jgi:NACHT domain